MTVVVAWATIAAALGGLMRNVGPWWRVALGCAAWPALPAVVVVSYVRYRVKRTSKAAVCPKPNY